MKKKIGILLLSCVFLAGTAFAEPGGGDGDKASDSTGRIKQVTKTPVKEVSYVVERDFIDVINYQKEVIAVLKDLNELSPKAAKVASQVHDVMFRGDDAVLQRLPNVAISVMDNLLTIVEKAAEKDPTFARQAKDLKASLAKAYAYNFGPERPKSVNISKLSNEGKGVIAVNSREIRYAITPGLSATKQDEREVIAVERLPDGEFKVALGIFYVGQETADISWDPRTYTRVDWFLDYHNVCKAQAAYLTCGKSECVPFSENKTVTKK